MEGNGRYYLSNKGLGAGQGTVSTNTDAQNAARRGFGVAVKAGLKFYF